MPFENVVVYACPPECPVRTAKELQGNRLAREVGWTATAKSEIDEWSDE